MGISVKVNPVFQYNQSIVAAIADWPLAVIRIWYYTENEEYYAIVI